MRELKRLTTRVESERSSVLVVHDNATNRAMLADGLAIDRESLDL